MSQFDDDLELLGVPTFYDAKVLKLAYHAEASVTHPDAPGGSAERFDAVVKAYRRLEALLKTGKRPCAGCRGQGRIRVAKGFHAGTKPCPDCRGAKR